MINNYFKLEDDEKFFNFKIKQYELNLLEENKSCWLVNIISKSYLGIEIISELFRRKVNSNLELLSKIDTIINENTIVDISTMKIIDDILKMRKNLLTGVLIDDLYFEEIIDESEKDRLIVLLSRILLISEEEAKEIKINVLVASLLIIQDDEKMLRVLELFDNLTNFYIIPNYVDIGYNTVVESINDDYCDYLLIPIDFVLIIKSIKVFFIYQRLLSTP